jgi:hypothetical protein
MGLGAATSGNFVGLFLSINAVQLDRHPPAYSRPPVFQPPKLAPHFGTVSAESSVAPTQRGLTEANVVSFVNIDPMRRSVFY